MWYHLQAEMLAYRFLLVLLGWRVASVVGEWSGSTACNVHMTSYAMLMIMTVAQPTHTL